MAIGLLRCLAAAAQQLARGLGQGRLTHATFPPPMPLHKQAAPSQKSKRAFGPVPVPPSERRMSGSLAQLQLTQPVPWQPPTWWDVQVAVERSRMGECPSPSRLAALLDRLATMRLRDDAAIDLESLRRRYVWRLRQQHPAMNDPAAVASSTLQVLWRWTEQSELYALLIAWIALALVSHCRETARGLQRCMACLKPSSTSCAARAAEVRWRSTAGSRPPNNRLQSNATLCCSLTWRSRHVPLASLV